MPLAGQMTTFYLNFDNKQVGRIKKSASKRKKTGMRRKGLQRSTQTTPNGKRGT
jgi:ABC-type xylose transport system substrate-binding protein